MASESSRTSGRSRKKMLKREEARLFRAESSHRHSNRSRMLLADRGYDADWIRELAVKKGAKKGRTATSTYFWI